MKQHLIITMLLLGASIAALHAQDFSIFKTQKGASQAMNNLLGKTKIGQVKSSQVKQMSGKDFLKMVQKDASLTPSQKKFIQKDFSDLDNIRVILTAINEASCADEPFGRYIIISGNVMTQRIWMYTACGKLRCELGLYTNHYVRPCDQYFAEKAESQPCETRACINSADLGCCIESRHLDGNCAKPACFRNDDCKQCKN